ncbi:hypothetical protein F4815DRAFT_34374 [Daldinia loculata]|uniref:uncharacterized protein n=1 Tax=Daldinia loculata TaxID=103429 RepID=UPI0020C588A8|nr:uncharacterized protein F4817DRAFT_362801 [Daldinia loculata]KAI1641763.1 hypothetical protein F4817DRAFT_362801 [Daldinia loculata]KAI2782361.1 hypothetical protein F4815DRAFT_34374 [Daldinia loculata]
MTTPEVSHGRGGAGNINPDDTKYVDGEIVRQGHEGSHGDGAFSTGRGGAANIADADKPPSAMRTDRDIVPEEATRPSTDGESFHVGRGGAANVHLSEQDKQKKQEKHHGAGKVVDSPSTPGTAPNLSLADKLKHKIFGVFKK